MIEHVVGRRCIRARIARGAVRTVVLPTLTVFPVRGPLARAIPLVDLVCVPFPRSRVVRRSRVVTDNWTAEHIVPSSAAEQPDGAILYMHGGAFVFGGLNTHRTVADALAAESGQQVLNLGYRMFPRGLVSDAVDDVVEAFLWLVEQGTDPAKVVLAGDSAGGHLAFAATLALRELGYETAGIVGFSPWLDFDHTSKTSHFNRDRDVMIPASRLRGLAPRLLGAPVAPEHSPVNADLTGLPPVLMICAEDEVLRADAELMRERLLAHGVPVELQIWSGTMHAFPAVPLPVPDFRDARSVAADFVRDCVATAASAELAVVVA